VDLKAIREQKIAKYDHIDEKELIRGLRVGDNGAYEALLDLYEGGLYRFFYYAHGKDDLAQDQCGETLEVFVSAIHKMRSEEANSLKSFLFGIARNVMRRSLRQRKILHVEEIVLENVVDEKTCVFREAVSREEISRAFKAIGELKEVPRQIFLLRFVEMFTLEEIAEVMNIPINTIKSHIYRGRKQICDILNISEYNEAEL